MISILYGPAVLVNHLYRRYETHGVYSSILAISILGIDFFALYASGLIAIASGIVVGLSMIVTVFLACLGLFGLVISRLKEFPKEEHITSDHAISLLIGLVNRVLHDNSEEAFGVLVELNKLSGKSKEIIVEEAAKLDIVLDDFVEHQTMQVAGKYRDKLTIDEYPWKQRRPSQSHDSQHYHLMTEKQLRTSRKIPLINQIIFLLALGSVSLVVAIAFLTQFDPYYLIMIDTLILGSFVLQIFAFQYFFEKLYILFGLRLTTRGILNALSMWIPDFDVSIPIAGE
ncbi:MAG: hypothetical protein RTU30_12600 [Candidatus Thorarchaeota archaeon]